MLLDHERDHRDVYGVEAICHVLPTAPSTYLEQIALRDQVLKPKAARVFVENVAVYGVHKVRRRMMREGFPVARCTIERPSV